MVHISHYHDCACTCGITMDAKATYVHRSRAVQTTASNRKANPQGRLSTKAPTRKSPRHGRLCYSALPAPASGSPSNGQPRCIGWSLPYKHAAKLEKTGKALRSPSWQVRAAAVEKLDRNHRASQIASQQPGRPVSAGRPKPTQLKKHETLVTRCLTDADPSVRAL